MAVIEFKHKGNFKKTDGFLKNLKHFSIDQILDFYGQKGVEALKTATPVDTGTTASSWYYEIIKEDGKTSVVWKNRNIKDWVNVAVIIQYGHATSNGSWVEGIDYINPALQPIFNQIAEDAWTEIRRR
jgi:hypothetical protein